MSIQISVYTFLYIFQLIKQLFWGGRDSWLHCFNCYVSVCALCLSLVVPLAGLLSVTLTSPGQITYLLAFKHPIIFQNGLQ